MSGGLAPSKSTVYVGNLPFSLTNNDLHKVFEKYGKVVKVTIVKDKDTRRSKGVAFVLFLDKDAAQKAVHALNNTQMFGRTVKCNIAKDNGRTTEFIRRKVYTDKSQCYECGEYGHLSYKCPKNLFGERKPPEKKKRKHKEEEGEEEKYEESESEGNSDQGEDPALDTLAAAIQYQQDREEEDEYRFRVATGNYNVQSEEPKKKRYKKDGYFSDEEELDD